MTSVQALCQEQTWSHNSAQLGAHIDATGFFSNDTSYGAYSWWASASQVSLARAFGRKLFIHKRIDIGTRFQA